MTSETSTTGDSWLDSRPPWTLSTSAPFRPCASTQNSTQSIEASKIPGTVSPLSIFSHVLRLNAYFELENIPFHDQDMSRISIGEGTTFVVEKSLLPLSQHNDEPKWVAVKRAKCVIPKQTGQGVAIAANSLRRLKAVLLELEVLLHPPLKSHPNIVKLLGSAWDSETPGYVPLLVMELASFGSLSQLFSTERINDTEKRELCLDAAMGLEALHSCLITHGDVKQENVLVFPHPRRRFIAKFSDFGLALLESDELVYRGTTIYNAPEVHRQGLKVWIRGSHSFLTIPREELPKCDAFSFGLLVFEILNNGQRYYNLPETAPFRAVLMSKESDPHDILDHALKFLHSTRLPEDLSVLCHSIFRKTICSHPLARIPEGWASVKQLFSALNIVHHHLPYQSKAIVGGLNNPHSILEIWERVPGNFAGGDLVAELQAAAETGHNRNERARASFDLFVITALNFPSFGITLETEALDWLAQAAFLGHEPSLRVGRRIFEACKVPVLPTCLKKERSRDSLMKELDDLPSSQYYSTAVRLLWSGEIKYSTGRNLESLSKTTVNTDKIRKTASVTSIHDIYPLHLAVISGAVKSLACLLDLGYDVNKTTPDGLTAVHVACMLADIESIRLLLKHGADASINDQDNISPLHWLIMFKDEDISYVANMLIEGGGNVNSCMADGAAKFIDELGLILQSTPLRWATMCRNHTAISVLLSQGARTSVGTPDHDPYWTICPVEAALATVCPDTLELLLNSGRVLQDMSDEQKKMCKYRIASPTSNPVQRWCMHGSDYEGAYASVLAVLNHFNLDIQDSMQAHDMRSTPLCLAATRCNIFLAKALIQNGADVNMIPKDGGSAISEAIIGSFCLSNPSRVPMMVQLLLDFGARLEPHIQHEISKTNQNQNSLVFPHTLPLLHMALQFGAPFPVVKLILQKAHYQVNMRWGWGGKTAIFHVPSVFEGPILVRLGKLLLDAGADLSIESTHDDDDGSSWTCCTTPAMLGVDAEEWGFVKLCLDHGASLTFGTSGRHQRSLVHYIIRMMFRQEYTSTVIDRKVRMAPLVQLLDLILDHPASKKANVVDMPDYRGLTPLVLAVIWGLPECVAILLEHGAQLKPCWKGLSLLCISQTCYSPNAPHPFVVSDELNIEKLTIWYEGLRIHPCKRSDYVRRLDEISLHLGFQGRPSGEDDSVVALDTNLLLLSQK